MLAYRNLNNKGTSLVQVMVAVALTFIVAGGMASLLSYVFREVAHVDAKLSVAELQRTLTTVAPGVDLCQSEMKANPEKFKFKKDDFYSTKKVSLSRLAFDATLDHILVQENENLFGNGNVKIKSITLSNPVDSGGKIVVDLTIDFDSKRSFRPIVNKLIIQSNDIDATNLQLTGCQTGSASAAGPPPGSGDNMTEEQCLASGGLWVNITGTASPPFCSFENDVIEWY